MDLHGTPPDKPASPVMIGTPEAPPSASSPTALEVDAWGLRRGRDLVAESDRLKQSGTDAFAAADFFQAAFDPDPRLCAACDDPNRHRFVAQLLDTPEYHALHAATRLDDTAAAIAATHFAEQYARLTKEDTKRREDGAAAGDDLAEEMATLRAVGKAVAEAGKEVSDLHEVASALGMGAGTPGGHDPKAVAALFRRVRTDPTLKKICELAGRFRRVAQSKQRQKVTHGLDDVVGVEPGGDVGRLLPVELGKLMVPELELDTLRRIVERQAFCREHHAVEPVGKGPVIVCLDESGSMGGDRIHMATALALALAWIARHQRRWCALVAYSGDTGERLLPLPPDPWDDPAADRWAEVGEWHEADDDLPPPPLPGPGLSSTDRTSLAVAAGLAAGRWVLSRAPLPVAVAVGGLVAAIPVFGCPELSSQTVVSVCTADQTVAVQARPWTVRLPVVTGRYPDVAAVIPRQRPTVGGIDAGDARELMAKLNALPGPDDPSRPVTLVLAGGVSVLASDGERTVRVRLPRSPAAGAPVRVAIDRSILSRALKLGCLTAKVWAANKPVVFEGTGLQLVAAPLGDDDVVRDSVEAVTPAPTSTSTPDPNPQPPRRTAVKPESVRPHPPPDAPDPLALAEHLRQSLADAHAAAAKLVTALKGKRKEQKALAGVYASLKSLNLTPDREGP